MTRLVLFLVAAVLVAVGLSWIADNDRPASLVINWMGHEVETTVFRAVVLLTFLIGLSIFAWSIIRQVWTSPATVGQFFNRRRQERGLDALSSGMIAIGAGDRSLATRYAVQARKALPNEPLTHLLRAQAAELSGDRATSRRIFEAMLGSPDTEQLGLRGLFLEAEREGEREAARQFADRALKLNPKLAWPVDALFDLQCKASDWAGALETLGAARRHGHFEKPAADRRRALLLTAQAQDLEEDNGAKALDLALEAHNLAADLVPAAAIAARQLASRGSTPKAAKVIEKTWRLAPHPDLALVYAFVRPGDSPRDRLERIKRLSRSTPHASEGPIAVASAALEARSFDEARSALEPLIESQPSQRICTLMARIEGAEHNNAGGVREWLARAINAPRDPAWTADGVVSERWAAISPVTGALDAFQWRVPVESRDKANPERALVELEELMALDPRPEAAISAKPKGSPVAPGDADIVDFDIAPEAPAAVAMARPAPQGTVPRQQPTAKSQGGPEPRSPAGRSEASISVTIARPAAAAVEQVVVAAPPSPSPPNGSVPPLQLTSATARTTETAGVTTTPAAAPTLRDKPAGAAVAEAPTKAPAAIARPGDGDQRRTTPEPRLYVPPRAPDDPGPDSSEEIAGGADYPPRPAKRQG